MRQKVRFYLTRILSLLVLFSLCSLGLFSCSMEQILESTGLDSFLADSSQQTSEPDTAKEEPDPALFPAEQQEFIKQSESFRAPLTEMEKALRHINYLIYQIAAPNEINYTYFGEDGLYLKPTPALPEIYQANIEALNTLKESSGLPLSLIVSADAGVCRREKLPFSTPEFEADAVLDEIFSAARDIDVIDVRPYQREYQDEYICFQTDHHWTSTMAGLAASKLVERQEPFDFAGFHPQVVSDTFQGSLVQRIGDSDLYDQIVLYEYDTPPAIEVTWSDGTVSDEIYYWDGLQSWDQYQFFFGENEPIVTIETDVNNDRSILLLKDSYAHSMIQFLLPYYSQIVVVDPRYYSGDLNEILQLYQIDEITAIFWYDIFVSDGTLADLINMSSLNTEEG